MAFDVRNTDEKPKKKRREGEAVAASPANALRTDIKNGNQATQQEQQTQQSGGLWGGLSGQRSTFDVRTAAQTRHPVWGDLPGRTGGFDVRTAQRQQGGGLWGGLDREETGSFDVRTAAEAMKRPGKKRDPEVVAAQNANRAQVGAMTRMEDEIRENNPLDSLRVGGNNGIISMADYQALVDKYSGYSDIPGMVEDAAGERRDEALELMNSPERMGEEEYRIAVERLIGEVDWDSYNAYRRINEQLKAIADEEGMAEATATRMIGSVEDTARDANAHPVERDLAQRYAEQIRALEEARDTEGSHLLYAGGRFTGGLLGGVIDPISAGYMVVDAASGGKTAEIQRQLSEYFAANPDKNVYNTPIFALPEEIRALGITEADYRRYILTHVEEEYRMHVEEEDGVGLNPVYKKIVGDFVAENLGRQLPAILITYGTGTGSGTGVLGALRAGGWSAAGKRLVSALKGNLSTWIMGAGAAGGTYTQALDEGDSTAQAVARAVSNGFVEGFTEGLFGFDSFDGLKSMMTGSSGSILRNMMSNAARLLIPSGEESLEEVTAGVMNRTIDQLIGGGSDLMPQRLDGGRPMKWFGEGGVFDMAQMGDDALGGFIGGLTLSSAATVTAAAQVMQETQNAREASEILNGVAAYAMPEEMRPVPLNPERATLPEIQANARAIMEWLGKLRTDTSTQMAAETWLVQQMYISDLESQVRGTGALGENDYLARLTYEEQGDSLPTETRPALLETGMAAPAGTPVRAAAEQLQNANERNVLQNVGRLQSMVRARNAGEMVTALRNEGMMRGDTETETEADTETEAAPEDLAYKPGPAAMKATVTTEAGSAEADILGVTGQGKDAVIRMRAADGTEVTVPVAEAEISDENTRALVDHAVELDYAQPMIAAYSRGQDAGVYATGFELAREYGYWNRMTEEQLLKSDVLTGLTDRQKLLAYQLGVDARAARDAQEKEKTAARRERAREAARKAGKAGSVDESAIMGMNLTENQRAGVAASRQVAGALGIKIVWMRSKAELDEMTGSKVYRSDNGAWDPQTMTMYLDINAGVNVEGDMRFAVERTMMHEVTHYVYSFADESLIRAYEDFVITQAMRGDPDGEIRERLEKAKFGSKEREEIVAEASENVTLSEETMTRLAEQNRTLWEKIRDFLKKWVEDLRAALAKAKGTEKNALNAAARAVEAVQEEVDRMFGEALVSAQRNRMEAAQEIAQRAKTVKDATVAVAPEVAEVMESADYHMPEDRMMSLRTTDRWKELHRERYGASAEFEAQAAMIEAFDMRVAEDAVLRYAVPHGIAPTGRAAKGTDTAAPLRGNVEYRYTFDLDTICDRTLQFRMYRSAVEERIGRKLRETESRQLIELMRAYRLMIPCTYCYVENKRMRLADLYAEQIKKRSGELPEGYATPEAVFAEVEKARTIVAGYMDATYNKPENYSVDRRLAGGTFEGYRDFRLPTTEEAAADEVAKKYGITERKAKSVLLGMVSEWNYARSMDVPLNLANEDADWQTDSMNEQVLVFHKNATTSAQGGAKAKGESSFEAYTDQLARISEEDKDFIIGMGGIRKHSSNDFQIQNVQDYMLFFMDLAADKRGGKAWTGHTYTKSIDYAKIFAPTHDRINVSVAFHTVRNGDGTLSVIPNEQEGADQIALRDLRLNKKYGSRYKDVGAMAMVTDNTQLSYALNSDFIDMIIPFHASGMPRALWYDTLAWTDYTSKQSEKLYNKTRMAARLKADGIAVRSSMKAAQVAALYDEHFQPKKIYNKDGKRIAAHFYPGDTVRYDENGNEVILPGHHNDKATYLRLCEEYATVPRFDGIKVLDAEGREINVIDHPNYMRLVKETARTDSPQEPIVAEFDMDAVEEALQGLKQTAQAGLDKYSDSYGVVDEFIENYIESPKKGLKWLPERARVTKEILDEMSAEARETARRKLEEDLEQHSMDVAEDARKSERRVIPEASAETEYPAALREAMGLPEDARKSDRKRVYEVTDQELLLGAAINARTAEERRLLNQYKSAVMEYTEQREKMQPAHELVLEEKRLMEQNGGKDKTNYFAALNKENTVKRGMERAKRLIDELVKDPDLQRMIEREKNLMHGLTLTSEKQREAEARERIRTVVTERTEKLTEKLRKREREYRDNLIEQFSHERYFNAIERTAKSLTRKLTQPKTGAYVPEVLQKPILDLLMSIDAAYNDADTVRNRKISEDMVRLAEVSRRLMDREAEADSETQDAETFLREIDLPRGLAEQFTELAERVERAGKAKGGVLKNMSAAELKALSEALTIMNTAVENSNKLLANARYGTVEKLGTGSMGYLRKQRSSKSGGTKLGNYLNWRNATPVNAFDRFGDAGKSVFGELQDAQDKLAELAKKVIAFTGEAYKPEEAKAWSEEEVTIELGPEINPGDAIGSKAEEMGNTRKVTMTVAQAMSVYCLAKREAARHHMTGYRQEMRNEDGSKSEGFVKGGGIRIENYERKGKGLRPGEKVVNATNIWLSEADVEAIGKALTERQKSVATALQTYMSTTLSDWGNWVTLRRFGVHGFEEQNYFPMEVNPNALGTRSIEIKESLYRLLNMGFTKRLTERAKNPIMVRNIFDVFAKHAGEMAMYRAYALPVLDTIKWLNYKESDTQTLQGEMERVFGREANNYVITLLQDINGKVGDNGVPELFDSLMRSYKIAAVGASLSTSLMQPTSYLRAAAMLDAKYLAAGARDAVKNMEVAKSKVGIAQWKDLGYYDTNIGRSLASQIRQQDGWREKIVEKSMWLTKKGDEWTMGAIYGAVVAETKDLHPELKGEEFDVKVNERMRDIVYRTQVVDSPLMKSQFMRNKSYFAKLHTAFMSEPTVTANLLMSYFWQASEAVRMGVSRGTAMKMYGRNAGRILTAWMATTVLETLARSLIGALRDDDDYENIGDKFMEQLPANFAKAINPLSLVPLIGSGVEALLTGESVTDMSTEPLTGIYQAGKNIVDLIQGKDVTGYKVVYDLLRAVSQATGIPISNATRDVVALWNTGMDAFGATGMKLQNYQDSDSKGYAALYDAMVKGNEHREGWLRRQLATNGAEDEATRMRSLIKDDYNAGDIDADEAMRRLTEYAGDGENAAYWKVREWDAKAGGAETWSKADEVIDAILNGGDWRAEWQNLITYATSADYDDSDARSAVRSRIKSLFEAGRISEDTARSLLATCIYGSDREAREAVEAWLEAMEEE